MAQEWNESISKIVTVRTTGAVGLAYSLKPKNGFQLIDYRLNSATTPATSEELVVTLNAYAGSAYDTVISRTNMNGVDDLYEDFDNMKLVAGDSVDFAWTNTNTVTYGLVMTYRRLS